ncbi:MAG TPA: crossover junction endodeoxyribonuclease RuvC [Candidatus Babeliales bacterium]|nr:crossover junction endodeoxyribonuclease RuvC [Candidatus Babeliales bacterium]
MVILGVDPGFQCAGFGILKKEGRQALLLDYGYLEMSPSDSLVNRVGKFHEFFEEKVITWQVTVVALETPFLGKNAQNFLKLGYLRGILYLLAHKHKTTLQEFAPTEVKQSVTGFGGATKDQVARVILQLFPGMEVPKKEDVTDAIAVTLCGLWSSNQNSLLQKLR